MSGRRVFRRSNAYAQRLARWRRYVCSQLRLSGLALSEWWRRARWKLINFDGVTDAQLAQAIITMRLEQPYNSTLMVTGDLRKKLAEVGLAASEWNICVSCLCMEEFMVRNWTGNATNSRNVGQSVVADCFILLLSRSSATSCSSRRTLSTTGNIRITWGSPELERRRP